MKHIFNIFWITFIIIASYLIVQDCTKSAASIIPYVQEVKYENTLHDSFDNLQAVIHEVTGQATNLANNVVSERRFTTFHIGSGYLLTCAHCTNYPKKVPIRTPYGIMYRKVNWGEATYTSEGSPITFVGSLSDVAVLHNPDLIGSAVIPFGDSDLLRVGDTVTDIGNSMMLGINIKSGMVSMIGIKEPVLNLPEVTKYHTIVISTPVIGGDSGSPLLVYNLVTNRYEIIGMVFAGTRNVSGYNYAILSKYLKAVISEIKGSRTNKYRWLQ